MFLTCTCMPVHRGEEDRQFKKAMHENKENRRNTFKESGVNKK